MLHASAATRVSPLFLHQVAVAAKGLVEFSAGCFTSSGANSRRRASGGGAEIEIALIGIFFTAGVKPGVQVRICDGFFAFVGHDIDHAIRAANTGCRAIGTRGLGFAATGAAIRVTDKCVLNVCAAQGSVSMETAILGAESRSLIDIRGREHHIYAIGRRSEAHRC